MSNPIYALKFKNQVHVSSTIHPNFLKPTNVLPFPFLLTFPSSVPKSFV